MCSIAGSSWYDIERSSVPCENSSAINLGKEERNDEQKDLF